MRWTKKLTIWSSNFFSSKKKTFLHSCIVRTMIFHFHSIFFALFLFVLHSSHMNMVTHIYINIFYWLKHLNRRLFKESHCDNFHRVFFFFISLENRNGFWFHYSWSIPMEIHISTFWEQHNMVHTQHTASIFNFLKARIVVRCAITIIHNKFL